MTYGRHVHTGPFFATSTQWGAFDAPGTCEVLVTGADYDRMRRERPVVAGVDDPLGTGIVSADTVPGGQLLAVWFGVGGHGEIDDAEYRRARETASRRHVPLLVYFDGYTAFSEFARSLLQPGDWAGVMGYPQAGETAAQTVARIEANLDAVAGWPVALVRPLYTKAGLRPLSQVLALQAPLVELVARRPEIVADLWFSWARPSGALDHPELAAWGPRLEAASVAPPAPEPTPVPAPTPTPDPPVVIPPPRFAPASRYEGHMPKILGYIVGSGGGVGRVDPSEKRLHFDRAIANGHNAGGHELVELLPRDNGKFAVRFVDANVVVNGAPKWQCGTDLDRQFETRPADQIRGHEEWTATVQPNGRIQLVIEHEENGQRFTSVPLTFVENR